MDTQQRNTLEQYKPALKLAGKTAGWALLLPALAVYWLFMLVFKLAGATLNRVATSDGWMEDGESDEIEEEINDQMYDSDFDLIEHCNREGGYKYGSTVR